MLKTLRTILEQRLEQKNTQALKEWGDAYKKQLLAEKNSKANAPGGGAAGGGAAGAKLMLPSSLGTYVSVSNTEGTTTPEGISPSAKRGAYLTAPAATTTEDSPSTNSDHLPVRPHPQLIPQPSRKQLHVHVPFSGEAPQPLPTGASITPLILAQQSAGGNALPTPWSLNSAAGGAVGAGPTGSPLPDGTPTDAPFSERATVEQATVLLVDPSDATRETLSNWLASINYTLLTQPTLEDALEFLRRSALPKGSHQLQRSSTLLPTLPQLSDFSSGPPAEEEKTRLNRLISMEGPHAEGLLLPTSLLAVPHSATVRGSHENVFSTGMDHQQQPMMTTPRSSSIGTISTDGGGVNGAPARSITHLQGSLSRKNNQRPSPAAGSSAQSTRSSDADRLPPTYEFTPAFGPRRLNANVPVRPTNHVDLVIADADVDLVDSQEQEAEGE